MPIFGLFKCDNTKTINLYYVHLKKTQAGGQKKCRPLLKTFFICISYLSDNMFISWLCMLLMCNIWGGGGGCICLQYCSKREEDWEIVVLFSVNKIYQTNYKKK